MKFAVSRLIIFSDDHRYVTAPTRKLVFIYLSLYSRCVAAQTSEEKKKQESKLNFFLSCCCRCPTIKSLLIVENTFVFVCLSSGLDTKRVDKFLCELKVKVSSERNFVHNFSNLVQKSHIFFGLIK